MFEKFKKDIKKRNEVLRLKNQLKELENKYQSVSAMNNSLCRQYGYFENKTNDLQMKVNSLRKEASYLLEKNHELTKRSYELSKENKIIEIMKFIEELDYNSKISKNKGIKEPSVTCDYVISRLNDIVFGGNNEQ